VDSANGQHALRVYTGPAVAPDKPKAPALKMPQLQNQILLFTQCRRPAMNKPSSTALWRERLASPLTWHYVGFGILLALVIVLAVRLGLDWAATNGRSTDALAEKQMELKSRELQAAPLRGSTSASKPRV